jgi:type VI secretion system secreted protein Hcp
MAVDMILDIDGVQGESQKDGFKDKIDIFAYSLSANNPSSVATGAGSGAGKVSISSINVTKMVDKASASLFLSCCNGKHYSKAKLTVREAGGDSPVDYLVMDFEQVYVDSVSWGGSSGGDKPSENVSFSFAKVKFTYMEQDEKGQGKKGGEAGWDLQAGKKL